MEGRRNGEEVTVAGIWSRPCAPMRSRKGDRWAILNLQDMTGELEALVFPEAFARLETLLKSGAPLLLQGPRERGRRRHARGHSGRPAARPSRRRRGRDRADARARRLERHGRIHSRSAKEVLRGSPGPCPIAFDLSIRTARVATLRPTRECASTTAW